MLQGLFVAISIQGLVLGLLCFTARHRGRANRWLGIFFLSLAFQRFFQVLLNGTGFFDRFPWVLCSFEWAGIAGMFALHAFVLTVLNKRKRMPFYIYLLMASAQLLIFSTSYLTGAWVGVQAYYHHPTSTAINWVVLSYTFYVIIASLRSIRQQQGFAEHDNPQHHFVLGTVKWLLYYWGFRMFVALVFLGVRTGINNNSPLLGSLENLYLLVVNLLLIALLSVTAYFSLRNPAFFEQLLAPQPVANREAQLMLAVLPQETKKMLRPAIPPEEAEALMQQLVKYMDEQRPWLNPKLNLAKLSETVQIPAYKISKLIKLHDWHNFNEFVNQYRVAYAQQCLLDGERLQDTIYAIALDSGFASEATFYAAFHKIVGVSPAAWRQQQNGS
jgi:AraC-like DNA-binding protein